MDKKRIENYIIMLLISLLVSLFVAFVATYQSTAAPILSINHADGENFDFMMGDEGFFTLDVSNKGVQTGFAKICLSSNEFVFKGDNGEFVHSLCTTEFEVLPKESDHVQHLKIATIPNETYIESIESATITVSGECSQKIWGISKSCGELNGNTYNYIKDYKDSRNLIRTFL